VPASIIGWPDQAAERNLDEIAIPKLGSLYLTHSWDGAVKGLKDFPADQRPPVAVVYFAFRIMVGVGLAMLGMVALGLFLLARRELDRTHGISGFANSRSASALLPSSPAGPRPRSDGSRGRSTA
jgi:cytochrome bd-type quinol oxidase subunit 1